MQQHIGGADTSNLNVVKLRISIAVFKPVFHIIIVSWFFTEWQHP